MNLKNHKPVLFAILSALLYAVSLPVSKILLSEIQPALMSALLYTGAGLGMSIIGYIQHKNGKNKIEAKLSKKDLPFVVAMIILDIAAPIFLMIGLTSSSPANASLLSNFEIVATSLIALLIFKEHISKRLWLAIILITVSSIILSIKDSSSFSFSIGSLFILSGCICWGFENNCTRMLSLKDPLEVVIIKGFGSGAVSFIIAYILNQWTDNIIYIIFALILGFLSYGLSIFFYVYAQRKLGAAKTSAYYALSPFIGVGFSFFIFKEKLNSYFIAALLIMIIGTYLVSNDTK